MKTNEVTCEEKLVQCLVHRGAPSGAAVIVVNVIVVIIITTTAAAPGAALIFCAIKAHLNHCVSFLPGVTRGA